MKAGAAYLVTQTIKVCRGSEIMISLFHTPYFQLLSTVSRPLQFVFSG